MTRNQYICMIFEKYCVLQLGHKINLNLNHVDIVVNVETFIQPKLVHANLDMLVVYCEKNFVRWMFIHVQLCNL